VRHRRFAIALSVVVAALVLWLAFPPTAAHVVADRLGNAIGADVRISSIGWHPLRARWIVSNLRIAAERGAPALIARRIEAEVRLWDLLNGRYRVRAAVANGARIRLRATPSGWQLPLPSRSAEPSAATVLPVLQVDWASAPRAVILLEPAPDLRSMVRARQLEAMATLEPDRTQAMLWTKGRLDRGSIALVARVQRSADAHRLRIRIAAENMDVARVLRLASDASVRDVRGQVTVRAKYDEHGTGGDVQRRASGSLHGTDVALGTRGVDAIWTRRVDLSRFAVDLTQQQIVLGAVRLDQPEAWVRRTAGGFVMPGGSAAGAGGEAPAWTFRVEAIDVAAGTVHVADVERKQQVDLRIVKAHVGTIAGLRDPIATAVEATVDSGGRASVVGDVIREPPGARLRLDVDELTLPPLTRFANTPLALESGRIGGGLDLRFAENNVTLAGAIHVEDVKTVSPDPVRPEDVLAFKDMRVDIRRARTDPYSVDLARVELAWPYVLIDRTPTGIFPWTLVAARPPGEADSSPGRALPSLRLDRVEIIGGRLDFRDATLDPPYWRSLATFKSTAEAIDLPPLRVASLRATALVDELSPLRVDGTIGDRTHLVAEVQQLALTPFNPYLREAAPYTVSSGTISAESEIVLERSELEVQNRVVLSRLGLKGTTGDDFVQREVGVPLTLALALMTDYRGNIELGLPFGGNVSQPTFSMRTVLHQAIVRAIRGAVLSPLNALGRVILRDGRIEHFDLEPVPFAAGARSLDAAGHERIQQIARVVEAHPNLVLRVRGQVAQADVDTLQAQAALAALADDAASERLRAVLQARLLGGAAPEIRREDARRLETLLSTLPWPANALSRLALDRGAVSAASFIVDHKIDPARVAAEPPAEARPGTLGTVPSATVELRQR
jgi:hypothetical protein